MQKEQLAQEYADKIEASAWYTENHEVSQEVKAAVLYGYAACEDKYADLLAAAAELLQLKDWKDDNGKDEHYLKARPIAWGQLRTALTNLKAK